MYGLRRLFRPIPPRRNKARVSFRFQDGMLLEEIDLNTSRKECIHIRLGIGEDRNEVLLEAEDRDGERWLLGLPITNGNSIQGHREVLNYWREQIKKELFPKGGFLAKYEGSSVRCDGCSTTYPGEVDKNYYKELLQRLIEEGTLKTPDKIKEE